MCFTFIIYILIASFYSLKITVIALHSSRVTLHVGIVFVLCSCRRHLGGKVGALLEEKFKIEYMSELLTISLQELQANVGTKAG